MKVRYRFRSGTAAWLAVIMTIAPGATWSEQDGNSELRKELEAVKKQLRRVEAADEATRRVDPQADRREAGRRPDGSAAGDRDRGGAEEGGRAQTEDRRGHRGKAPAGVAAANKTFPSQFNPAIGFVIDTVGSYTGRTRRTSSSAPPRSASPPASIRSRAATRSSTARTTASRSRRRPSSRRRCRTT